MTALLPILLLALIREPIADLYPGNAPFLTLPAKEWKLTWHDEFDGDHLDRSRWSIGLPWTGDDGTNRHHNDNYASYIMDDDIAVSDGSLRLTTQRRDITNPSGKTYHYTEGLITTHGKFAQRYGYFEARLRVPTEDGPGMWPAFWTLAEGWPPEMDIAEFWTGENRFHQGLAFRDAGGNVRWDDKNTYSPLPSGWHTYGMEWGPGYQIYNRDGVVNRRMYGGEVTDQPNYILLNSGIDAHHLPGPSTHFPNTFAVDYVRVYARPDLPALLNGDFEDDDMAPWSGWHRASIVAYGARSGHNCLRLDPSETEPASAQQKVYGLRPNTRYRLRAFCRTVGNARAALGVKEFGDATETKSPLLQSAAYTAATLTFRTGPTATSATVYCWSEGSGAVFFDAVTMDEDASGQP